MLKKLLAAVGLLLCFAGTAAAQTACPYTTQYGAVLTPGQWGYCWGQKQDTLGYTPLSLGGGTLTGKLTLAPSTSSGGASLNIPPGTAPSSPQNGDWWVTSSGVYFQAAGQTVGPLTAGTGSIVTGTAGQLAYYGSSGSTLSGTPSATISAGALTLGGSAVQGSVKLNGSSSGTTTLVPQATASGTLSLPAATDTLVGRATTDTLSNKLIDTANTNTIKVNGNTLSATAGTATLSLPNSTDTLVGRATTDTLTNKSIAASEINSGQLAVANGGTNSATGQGAASNLGVAYILCKSGLVVGTGNDTTEDTLYTCTIPANALGANGQISVRIITATSNNANAHTIRLRYSGAAGTALLTSVVSGTASVYIHGALSNRNATNAQTSEFVIGSGTTIAYSGETITAVDTTASSSLVLTCQKAVGGDECQMDSIIVELFSNGA